LLQQQKTLIDMAMNEHCNNIESQRQIWLREQLAVAAKVKVLPDDDTSNEEQSHGTNQDFLLLSTSTTAILQQPPQPASEQGVVGNETSNPFCDKNYYFGGVDVSVPSDRDDHAESVAVYVIIDARTMKLVYRDYEFFHLKGIPYISSFLAFREMDPLIRLIQKQLKVQSQLTPRAILVDGNGILHCRKAGLACFVGVRSGIPSIGVAKTLYCQGGLTERIVKLGINLSLHRAIHHRHHAEPIKNRLRGKNGSTPATETPEATGIVIWDRKPIRASKKDSSSKSTSYSESENVVREGNKDSLSTSEDRREWIHSLPSSCLGLAIPLESRCIKDCNGGTLGKVESSIDNFEVLASVLVGHGGRGSTTTSNNKCVKSAGSKSPIFISVGHEMSLQNAVQICALLSLFRIPEPVRQADLMGRELLRRKKEIIK
jgi:deoxyinosine 3'endonuclease (endonuclease V)